MAMSLASLKKTTAKANPLTLLYGVAGVGKDTLAAEFPAPVLIPTYGENPPDGVEIDAFPTVDNFDGLLDALEALYNEDHSFKTVILSSLDGVEKLVWSETCRRNNIANIEAMDFGKGYVAADAVWDAVVERLKALNEDKGMMIVLIGHAEITKFDDPAVGSYNRYIPKLHKRIAPTIIDACDIVGFLNYRTSLTEKKEEFGKTKTQANGAGQRYLHLEERPGFIAKSRYKTPDSVGPLKIGGGYDALAKFLPAV